MKRIVSVSVGSSKRDHTAEIDILGEKFVIERIGTDGDFKKALQMIKDLDGKVDAFGMGGIDLYVYGGNKRYIIKDAVPFKKAAQKTPIVDGSGLKNTLERRVIKYLSENGIVNFKGKKVLMTCAMDRFGMAQAFEQEGADLTIGDFIFLLNLPIPLKSLRLLYFLAAILAPIIVKLPFSIIYPVGKEQEVIKDRHSKYYRDAEVIAGDYLFIKRYMPVDMTGKTIITNTVTAEDVKLMRERGVELLVTTTPEINGRSFGTNVMEAVLVCLAGKAPEEMTPEDYNTLLDKIGFRPRVEYLQK
ncbi:hypothetical protein SAMN02746089_01665 [Caldanaerobius fijiensis DSM 17918]|uniref:Quinate 5-dehydrogenase n=1 Tax=Caldanaerobius fijiensis DSM 17918 TaxID=1121256 RepID=A0A1M5AJ93_9THEO|nr:quinate 5-dehydrogenase [Caldanaerobius fijiensis]SHF30351.1 hypothetical protein SAMN02746089_01665 [Caldanaerobius fijiensis DSM 17918]